MKNKTPLLEQTVLSPFLVYIWENVWAGLPYRIPSSLDEYLIIFEMISRRLRFKVGDDFQKLLRPTGHTEEYIADMEFDLSWLLSTTNELKEECFYRYALTRKQRRLLLRIQEKNEKAWERINVWLIYVANGNDDLFEDSYNDCIAKNAPIQNNSSFILNDFQSFLFQKN